MNICCKNSPNGLHLLHVHIPNTQFTTRIISMHSWTIMLTSCCSWWHLSSPAGYRTLLLSEDACNMVDMHPSQGCVLFLMSVCRSLPQPNEIMINLNSCFFNMYIFNMSLSTEVMKSISNIEIYFQIPLLIILDQIMMAKHFPVFWLIKIKPYGW